MIWTKLDSDDEDNTIPVLWLQELCKSVHALVANFVDWNSFMVCCDLDGQVTWDFANLRPVTLMHYTLLCQQDGVESVLENQE